MAMDQVIDKYSVKRILGVPGRAVAKEELNCWTVPDDAQVDTPSGIISIPGGSVILEHKPGELSVFSITEFTELYVITGVLEDDADDVEDVSEEAAVTGDQKEPDNEDIVAEELSIRNDD